MTIAAQFDVYRDRNGRISRLPAKHSKKIALCMEMLNEVEFGTEYSEPEINELFGAIVDDFAFVRRTLVDLGYLVRDAYGISYRRSEPVPLADN